MRKISGEINVFATEYSDFDPKVEPDPDRPFRGLTFHHFDPGVISEWTYVGKATVALEMETADQIIENKVESLRKQAKDIAAEATQKCSVIERRIQSLLAISYTPEES